MSFKENLLKKIEIDNMSKKVINSIPSPESDRKIDRETMRNLLETGSYKLKRERDLDLYIPGDETSGKNILVLDNELPVYNTTVADIALRKSPTVKEMLSIRNIIKILNDKDVVVSKREESVKTIQKECIALLDLSFNKEDIEEIEKDGAAALENSYAAGVLESLALFSELIGYQPAPKSFQISNHKVVGALTKKETGEVIFGPIVIYSMAYNKLFFIDEQADIHDKKKLEKIKRIVKGDEKALVDGADVFQYLKASVFSFHSDTNVQYHQC